METINNEVRKIIKLNTQLDVIQFTHAAAKCKGEVDCLEENRNINGKSILGILSMNLSEPITAVFHNTDEHAEFLKEIEKWEVKDIENN